MKDWYVLFTGYENTLVTMKRLVKSCLPKGCGAYVPVKVTGNKERPNRFYNQSVYPFYIFICCTDKSQLSILEQKMKQMRIDGYFLTEPNGEIATLTSDEIRKITANAADESTKELKEMNGFTAGDSVKVIGGPMEGFSSRVAFVTSEYAFISLVTHKKNRSIEIPVLYSDLERL